MVMGRSVLHEQMAVDISMEIALLILIHREFAAMLIVFKNIFISTFLMEFAFASLSF